MREPAGCSEMKRTPRAARTNAKRTTLLTMQLAWQTYSWRSSPKGRMEDLRDTPVFMFTTKLQTGAARWPPSSPRRRSWCRVWRKPRPPRKSQRSGSRLISNGTAGRPIFHIARVTACAPANVSTKRLHCVMSNCCHMECTRNTSKNGACSILRFRNNACRRRGIGVVRETGLRDRPMTTRIGSA